MEHRRTFGNQVYSLGNQTCRISSEIDTWLLYIHLLSIYIYSYTHIHIYVTLLCICIYPRTKLLSYLSIYICLSVCLSVFLFDCCVTLTLRYTLRLRIKHLMRACPMCVSVCGWYLKYPSQLHDSRSTSYLYPLQRFLLPTSPIKVMLMLRITKCVSSNPPKHLYEIYTRQFLSN